MLGNEEYHLAAGRAADFILSRLRTGDGRLLRRYRQGEAAIPAFLEDYAFFTWGLCELYQSNFATRHLAAARDLTEQTEELFADGRGGYYDTGADAETVLTRGRSLQDGALPSGTSVQALNLLRLARMTGDSILEERGERLLRLCLPQAERYPSAYPQLLIALDYALGPRTEVVLASPDGNPPRQLLQAISRSFRPEVLVLLQHPGDSRLDELAPPVAGKGPVAGRPAAWVCRDNTCLPPVTDAEDLAEVLEGG